MYKFEITIQAETQKEAEEKLKCASIFIRKLKTRELKRFAEVIEKEPMKVAMAKRALGL